MSPTVAPLPRADLPGPTGGEARLRPGVPRGFSLPFWALLLYLFVASAAIDEEWPAVARFRPRLLLGGFALLYAGARLVAELGAARHARTTTPDLARAARRRLATWWGVFLASNLLSTFWAFDPGLAREALLDQRLPSLLVFPLVAFLVGTRREVLWATLAWAGGYGVFLVRSLQEYANGRYVVAMGVRRMVGAGTSHADPNSFAATVVFAVPVLVWLGIATRSWWVRAGAVLYGALAVLAVILTRSRSGLVLLVLAALFTLAALPSRRARVLALGFLVVAGVIASTHLDQRSIHRYLGWITGTQSQSEAESTEGRIRGYEVAWQMAGQRPILGVGPGCWSAYRMQKIDGDTLMPHNLTGQLLGTQGFFGVFAFLGFLASTVLFAGAEARRRGRAGSPWDRAVRFLCLSMLMTLLLLFVSGLAAHNLARPWWYAAPALVLAAAAARPDDALRPAAKEVS